MANAASGLILHASTVAIADRGVLIQGASGRGKSALALELMALGAGLVSDDRTAITVQNDLLVASCPTALSGRIEARFVGLLRAEPHAPVPIALVVDLDTEETHRLPPNRQIEIAGIALPLLHNIAQRYFPAAIRQYLLHGRRD